MNYSCFYCQIWWWSEQSPWFWKLTNIWGSNIVKQNITNLLPPLYFIRESELLVPAGGNITSKYKARHGINPIIDPDVTNIKPIKVSEILLSYVNVFNSYNDLILYMYVYCMNDLCDSCGVVALIIQLVQLDQQWKSRGAELVVDGH